MLRFSCRAPCQKDIGGVHKNVDISCKMASYFNFGRLDDIPSSISIMTSEYKISFRGNLSKSKQ